ncbi:hypothetical protein DFH08DRAFT_970582 [Mycena albidolilacea]|uniref:Uncharacterized protein n=1 Tax=Mycena albidolilacea TaxID=1033008 RepID=A0AAD6ZGJ3_9AGAR|nr:hypothetical protein DFH08DRAFT_970582 [Mycena albidolilacea]
MLEMLEPDDQRPQADRRCGAVRKLDAISKAGADETKRNYNMGDAMSRRRKGPLERERLPAAAVSAGRTLKPRILLVAHKWISTLFADPGLLLLFHLLAPADSATPKITSANAMDSPPGPPFCSGGLELDSSSAWCGTGRGGDVHVQTDGRTRTCTRHSAKCGVSYRGVQGWEGRSSRVEIVAAERWGSWSYNIGPIRSAKRQRRFDVEVRCGARAREVESILEREGKGRKNDFDGGAMSQRRKGHWNESACPWRLVRQVLSRLSAWCILLVAHMRTLEMVIYRRPSSATSSGTSATLPVGVHLHRSVVPLRQCPASAAWRLRPLTLCAHRIAPKLCYLLRSSSPAH